MVLDLASADELGCSRYCRALALCVCSRLCVEARDRQRRLLSYVLSAPQRVERYMESSWLRKWMWGGISLCTGFYAGGA